MSRSQAISVNTPSNWRESLVRRAVGDSSAGSRVMSGSIVMLAGSTLVSGFNFLYNVAMARMLGPALFGNVTAAATILMLFSAVTLSFQLVGAKFVARNTSDYGRRRVYQGLIHRSWAVGLALGAFLLIFSRQLAHYLRMPDARVLVVLAAGMAFYVPLGVRRGWMQGLCEFPKLTANFLIEAALKLIVAVVLVAFGYAVLGAVGALSASVIGAYLFTLRAKPSEGHEPCEYEPASFREGMQAIVFFVGQVVINNIDILMVKHFFDPADAGLYAAVALVGRVLYFACWSVVSAMFPVSAAAEKEESAWQVLRWPLLVVGGMSAAAVALMALFPSPIMRLLFGETFHGSGQLLALYAALTGLYALAVTLITFEMSRKIANTGWLQLVFSGMVVLGITLFHSTLRDVAVVQLVLMLLLLLVVSIPFLLNHKRQPETVPNVEEVV
jgi:O-antigen/teichoic acid export membrane protein